MNQGSGESSRAERLRSGASDLSTAQIFAAVTGALLTIVGIVSLVVGFDFSIGDGIVTRRLFLMDVNGWSGLLLLISGLALLVGTRSDRLARKVSLVVGGVFLVVTIWSLFSSAVIGALPINDQTAILYAAVAVLGITAGLAPDPRQSAT